MISKRTWSGLARVMAAGLLAAGLVACGGGGGGGGSDATPPPPPPTITTQPQAQVVADGAPASFTVSASGSGLSYQWQRGGLAIAGATATTLNLAAVALVDDGARFRVVVSNAGGSVTSNEVTLTVQPVAPTITTAPVAASVVAGQTASFTAVARGSAPLLYQWLRNGAVIPGATGSTYTTPVLAMADNGADISVRVSNAGGEVTSAPARLTVTALPGPSGSDGTRSLWLAATHTLALRSDGVLIGWGSNGNAQLGTGPAVPGSTATEVAAGVADASTGAEFSVAIGSSGALRGWGSNSGAWLAGSGSATYTTPQDVTWPVRAVRQVEAGWQPFDAQAFTVALLADGTVWHLPGSRDTVGGVVVNSARPVPGLFDVVALARGHGAAYAVRLDGTLWQISFTQSTSSGPAFTSARAAVVPGLANVRDAVCGTRHCLALLSDGTVRAWGEGRSGELGHGVMVSSVTPVVVTGLSDVTHVAVTSSVGASLARIRDGRVFSWGGGAMSARPSVRSGALLLPPPDVAVPTEVPSLAGSTEVACSENHCAARSADGRVRTWGNNLYRQLGVGTLPAQEPVLVTGINLDVPGGGTAGQRVTALRLLAVPRPGLAREGQTLSFHASATGRAAPSFQWLRNGAPIAGATGAAYTTPALAASDDGARYSVRVSDGSETVTSAEAPITVQAGRHSLWPAAEYTLALRNDGVLLGWGSNTRGQLASGAAVPGSAARQVASGMTRASSSATFATAVDGQGVWWGWGSDSDRWRAGTVPASGAPVVGVPAAVAWPARRVRQAEAALAPNSSTWQDSFVLLADGSVWALPGDRVSTTTEITEVAVQVPGLVDIVALSEGVGRRLAIRADGSVWTIGSLISARGVSYSASPFPGLANVRRVTCGRQHCLALLADGTLRAWGEGLSGELGQGAAASSSTPVVVTGLGNVTHLAVASDPGASFARTADGRVFSWGAGQTSGRAAPGTTAGVPPNALSPVEITSLSGSTELACSPSHCVARQADGSLWAWGANGSGQLGLPAPGFAQTPLRVTGIDLD